MVSLRWCVSREELVDGCANRPVARLRLGEALVHLDRAAEAVRLLEPYAGSSHHVRGWTQRVLGEAHLAEGRLRDAQANLRRALAIFRELRVPTDEARTRHLLATVAERLQLA